MTTLSSHSFSKPSSCTNALYNFIVEISLAIYNTPLPDSSRALVPCFRRLFVSIIMRYLLNYHRLMTGIIPMRYNVVITTSLCWIKNVIHWAVMCGALLQTTLYLSSSLYEIERLSQQVYCEGSETFVSRDGSGVKPFLFRTSNWLERERHFLKADHKQVVTGRKYLSLKFLQSIEREMSVSPVPFH